MRVLGIETSCDDTSVAILDGEPGDYSKAPKTISHLSFSQEEILKKWGGVVPEIASRNHLQKITPLLKELFEKSKLELTDIDLIGVTTHPGLLGPLLTGLNAAKTISLLKKTPIIPVNHLYAHLEAIHIDQKVDYPYLGLLVSGGHSHFFLVNSPTSFEVLGGTIDDAAGEAFDKGAKLMGLGYPGGRIIDEKSKKGDHKKYKFPVGLRGSKTPDLSYSGVKTSLREFIERTDEFDLDDLCASYQFAIVEALRIKLSFALSIAGEKSGKELSIVVGGGVACNSFLRESLTSNFKNVLFVSPKLCTDNGAMIANYALRTSEEAIQHPDSLTIDARSRFIEKKRGGK